MKIVDLVPLPIVIVLCLTLGLAPFSPQPHIWEKLRMLFEGTLVNPVDIFDLLMHSFPFILLGLKLVMPATAENS